MQRTEDFTFTELQEKSKSKEFAFEMPVIIHEDDGFGVTITIHSDDHGVFHSDEILSANSDLDLCPAHAHVFKDNIHLGRINITGEIPKSPNDVLGFYPNKEDTVFTPEIKECIFNAIQSTCKVSPDHPDTKTWDWLRICWNMFHPDYDSVESIRASIKNSCELMISFADDMCKEPKDFPYEATILQILQSCGSLIQRIASHFSSHLDKIDSKK
jgi:hypothetical protein